MEYINIENQFFSDLMEICGIHFGKRTRTDTEERSSEPRRTRKGQRKPSHLLDSDWEEGGNLVTTLAKFIEARGSAGSAESRPHLHLLYSGRKRLHSSIDVVGI